MIKVLFVCLGNICRSPLAEAIFNDIIIKNNLQEKIICDSCGTAAYHVGDMPDRRTIKVANLHGIKIDHRGRQLSKNDFTEFDYIIAMDKYNYQDIKNLEEKVNNSKSKVFLMREFDTDNYKADVPDPYYGDDKDFKEVFDILNISCNNFFEFIKRENNL
jgi:protein-tyrosine phosphatase